MQRRLYLDNKNVVRGETFVKVCDAEHLFQFRACNVHCSPSTTAHVWVRSSVWAQMLLNAGKYLNELAMGDAAHLKPIFFRRQEGDVSFLNYFVKEFDIDTTDWPSQMSLLAKMQSLVNNGFKFAYLSTEAVIANAIGLSRLTSSGAQCKYSETYVRTKQQNAAKSARAHARKQRKTRK